MDFSALCLTGSLLMIAMGCQKIDQRHPQADTHTQINTKEESKKIQSDGATPISSNPPFPDNASIEDQMEFQILYPLSPPEKFRERLLMDKSKFRKMTTSCYSSSLKPIFGDKPPSVLGLLRVSFELEPKVYLLTLLCGRGRAANSFVFFLFTEQEGIQPEALEVDVASVNQLGMLSLTKETQVFYSDVSYNPENKELSLRLGCHFNDGYIASRTVYRYDNRQLHLVEYWQDDSTNDKCLRQPILKQYYP
jgi:hypothetical protein